MNFPLYYAFDGASAPARAGASHATIYPYGPFPAGDGKTVMLGLQNEREWVIFCEQVLLMPELATDPLFLSTAARSAARKELYAIIVEAFSTMTAEEVIARLEKAQIANARLNEMRDIWEHAQLKARARWAEVASPVGALPALLPPGVPNTWTARMDAIPELGQHTQSILSELGYDAERINQLKSEKAI
jgi:itaconate CoA-transferase